VMATGAALASNMGDSEPSAFVDDVSSSSAYVYAVYGYVNPTTTPSGELTLARAQLNSGTAPLSFSKWNGQSFSSPGVGGEEAPILPGGSFQNCGAAGQSRHSGSIYYVETTQQYLLVFVCDSPTDPAAGQGSSGTRGAAWFYSTSYDLSDPSQWSAPQEIIGSWSPWDSSGGCVSFKGWYPTLMSLGAKPGHLSTSGYGFYLWGCEGGSGDANAPKRQFSSRAFTITTAPGPQINSGGIVIHGGVSADVSPGSLVDIYGSNMAIAAASALAGTDLPVTLGGAQVLVNGTAAPLIYVSARRSFSKCRTRLPPERPPWWCSRTMYLAPQRP